MSRQYFFKRKWRQFNTGDSVPANFDPGMIGTMERAGIVGCPGELKDARPERDKMVRGAKRKAS